VLLLAMKGREPGGKQVGRLRFYHSQSGQKEEDEGGWIEAKVAEGQQSRMVM
jgi:hypothetical protein